MSAAFPANQVPWRIDSRRLPPTIEVNLKRLLGLMTLHSESSARTANASAAKLNCVHILCLPQEKLAFSVRKWNGSP